MTEEIKNEIKEHLKEENQVWGLGLVKTLEKENKELKDLLNRSNLRLAEEQIKNEELIAENKALAEENNILVKGLGCETCSIHLEYENLNNQIAELKAQIKDLCSSLDIMNNRESELLAQIEKMKCCGNCKHQRYCYADKMIICHEWELAE